MIEEFSIGLDEGVKFTFKLEKPIEAEKLDFIKSAKTLKDVRETLDERGIAYKMEFFKHGKKYK